MGVLLNELFFPKTAPYAAMLIQAFGFCSIFIFRPVGVLIFGYIGDTYGRKSTVIITTSMMALSCVIMANLPTYSQIGITASWLITICRVFQGMSAMGEMIGAGIYLTETTKPPIQYPIVGCITVFSIIGAVAALVVATSILSCGLDWRFIFWFGAIITIIGGLARTILREPQEFIDARHKNQQKTINTEPQTVKQISVVEEQADKKTILFLFLMNCEWPITFYFVYIHCGNILKNSFGYSVDAIIHHNFIVALIQLLAVSFITFISYKIYPLKIIKIKLLMFFLFILVCPFLLNNITIPFHLLLIQIFIVSFADVVLPAAPIFLKHLPILKRFTYSGIIYALSRALMYLITSFGIIFLTKYFGSYGFLIIIIPIIIGCYLGVNYFEKLEKVLEGCSCK